jgi:uncharacterized protein YdeI (YjbR/CyaY-like superfamily)
MNKNVSDYFLIGCGRCDLGGTPDCKVHKWTEELKLLRSIINETGLVEECKWGVPCYIFEGKNVLILAAFKDYCSVSFFRGSLLKDEQNLLVKQGENTQAGRVLKFKALKEITKIKTTIKAYIFEAIEIQKADLKVESNSLDPTIPQELQHAYKLDPGFKSAFEALTKGRQRGYLIHFNQPKQSKTRTSRIEKCKPMILAGIGLNDKYKSGGGK